MQSNLPFADSDSNQKFVNDGNLQLVDGRLLPIRAIFTRPTTTNRDGGKISKDFSYDFDSSKAANGSPLPLPVRYPTDANYEKLKKVSTLYQVNSSQIYLSLGLESADNTLSGTPLPVSNEQISESLGDSRYKDFMDEIKQDESKPNPLQAFIENCYKTCLDNFNKKHGKKMIQSVCEVLNRSCCNDDNVSGTAKSPNTKFNFTGSSDLSYIKCSQQSLGLRKGCADTLRKRGCTNENDVKDRGGCTNIGNLDNMCKALTTEKDCDSHRDYAGAATCTWFPDTSVKETVCEFAETLDKDQARLQAFTSTLGQSAKTQLDALTLWKSKTTETIEVDMNQESVLCATKTWSPGDFLTIEATVLITFSDKFDDIPELGDGKSQFIAPVSNKGGFEEFSCKKVMDPNAYPKWTNIPLEDHLPYNCGLDATTPPPTLYKDSYYPPWVNEWDVDSSRPWMNQNGCILSDTARQYYKKAFRPYDRQDEYTTPEFRQSLSPDDLKGSAKWAQCQITRKSNTGCIDKCPDGKVELRRSATPNPTLYDRSQFYGTGGPKVADKSYSQDKDYPGWCKDSTKVMCVSDCNPPLDSMAPHKNRTQRVRIRVRVKFRYTPVYILIQRALRSGTLLANSNSCAIGYVGEDDKKKHSIPTGNSEDVDLSTNPDTGKKYMKFQEVTGAGQKDKTEAQTALRYQVDVWTWGQVFFIHDYASPTHRYILAHNVFLNDVFATNNRANYQENFSQWCSLATSYVDNQPQVVKSQSGEFEVKGSYVEPKCNLQVLVDPRNRVDCEKTPMHPQCVADAQSEKNTSLPYLVDSKTKDWQTESTFTPLDLQAVQLMKAKLDGVSPLISHEFTRNVIPSKNITLKDIKCLNIFKDKTLKAFNQPPSMGGTTSEGTGNEVHNSIFGVSLSDESGCPPNLTCVNAVNIQSDVLAGSNIKIAGGNYCGSSQDGGGAAVDGPAESPTEVGGFSVPTTQSTYTEERDTLTSPDYLQVFSRPVLYASIGIAGGIFVLFCIAIIYYRLHKLHKMARQ